jgi:hypothetical protein
MDPPTAAPLTPATGNGLVTESAALLELLGAGAFGAVVGWYLYYVNRYRRSDVQIGDLVTVIGAVGGGAVLALFPAGTALFGAYGIGLFLGFFGYLTTLVFLVRRSHSFTMEWFLDGRRRRPREDEYIPREAASTARAMDQRDEDLIVP